CSINRLMSDFEVLPHERQLACLAELARSALARYALPSGLEMELANLSENATYRLTDPKTGTRWALRVHRDGYHSQAGIASELAWLIDLRRRKVVTTPVPVPGRDGELIQKVGHPSMARPRHVVLSKWESGAEPGVNEDLRRPFEILGEVTA